jgi:glycosyltransferase involved in cell wall biosynthesis
MSSHFSSLSVVIPAYNEEKIISRNMLSLNEAVKNICPDYEIIIVDDASTDSTRELIRGLSREVPAIKGVFRESRGNFGSALRQGLEAAANELILYTDADQPFDHNQIRSAVDLFSQSHADLLKGYRINRSDEGFLRYLCTFFYNGLIRILFHVPVKDVNFAFKLIKRDVLSRLSLRSRGPFIDAEIVVKALYLGYNVKKIGVKYCFDPRRRSRLFGIGTVLLTLSEAVKLYPALITLKKRRNAQIPDC